MLNFSVQEERCNHCGLCVADCPSHIIEQDAEKIPYVSAEKEENCLQCQHCLAVCPTAAISVFGLNPAESFPVSADVWPTPMQLELLMRGRRSVRQYCDQEVSPAMIDHLLATVAHAPTGVNSRSLTFTVVSGREQMQRLRERVMEALIAASKAGRIPLRFSYIERAISAYVEHGMDVIFRGAPHVLIVSASPETPCATEDVPIAMAYFELLAQSAGLGTVWCGLLKLALESVPELKPLVDLPSNHHYFSMLFGVPAVHFARTVQRNNAATIKRLTIGNS